MSALSCRRVQRNLPETTGKYEGRIMSENDSRHDQMTEPSDRRAGTEQRASGCDAGIQGDTGDSHLLFP